MSLGKEVAKNSVLDIAAQFIRNFGGIIFTIIIARMLHPEFFGIYALSISIAAVFVIFTDLGLSTTIVRWIAHAMGKKDETLARSYYRYIFKLTVILSIVVSLVLFFSAEFLAISVFSKPELFIALQIMSLYVFFHGFFKFFLSGFLALKRFEYRTMYWLTFNVSRLVIVPMLILMGFSLGGALVGTVVSIFVGAVLLAYFTFRRYRFLISGKVKKFEKRTILRFLSFLSISSISFVIFFNIDTIMIGIFLPAEEVAFYKAAGSICIAIAGLLTLAAVLFPVFTELSEKKLRIVFGKVFRYSSMLSIPCTFGLFWVAEPFIKVIYGPEYLAAIFPLAILSLLIVETSTGLFFETVLNSRNLPEYPTKIKVVSMTLNIILNFFLIQIYGIMGAAFATVISRYFHFISLGIITKMKLDIAPQFSSIWKPVFASIIMTGFLYLAPRPSDIFIGVAEIVGATFIYFIALFAIRGVGKEDWNFMMSFVRR